MVNKPTFEVRKHFAEMAIEPIKSMVEGGAISDEVALGMIAQTTRNFRLEDISGAYRKFLDNACELFKDEANFNASYESRSDAYRYRIASENEGHLLFKLYEQLKGKDFENAKGLRAEMQRLLKNKKILELGCGPGFLVKVLQNLGAESVGVELRTSYKGRIPGIDIRYGSALNLDKLCKDESFDAIISNDFFATACVNRDEATKIASQMYDRTKENGLGLHMMTYEKMSMPVALFRSWMLKRKGAESSWEDWIKDMSEDEIEDSLWTNTCSLDPQYLLRVGFKLDEYAVDSGNFILAASKTRGSG